MITLNVKGVQKVTSNIAKIQAKLDKVPDEALKVFVANTPVRSGNARRNTKLQKDSIKANYPYAKRLNEGWSKQSPKGMVEPTLQFIRKRIKQIFAGK
jgi:hypothetical protein